MTEESTDAQAAEALRETTNEIIDMIVGRYAPSIEHSPARMTTATFMAVQGMLEAFGSPTLALTFALNLQAQGIGMLAYDNDCDDEDCEDDE